MRLIIFCFAAVFCSSALGILGEGGEEWRPKAPKLTIKKEENMQPTKEDEKRKGKAPMTLAEQQAATRAEEEEEEKATAEEKKEEEVRTVMIASRDDTQMQGGGAGSAQQEDGRGWKEKLNRWINALVLDASRTEYLKKGSVGGAGESGVASLKSLSARAALKIPGTTKWDEVPHIDRLLVVKELMTPKLLELFRIQPARIQPAGGFLPSMLEEIMSKCPLNVLIQLGPYTDYTEHPDIVRLLWNETADERARLFVFIVKNPVLLELTVKEHDAMMNDFIEYVIDIDYRWQGIDCAKVIGDLKRAGLAMDELASGGGRTTLLGRLEFRRGLGLIKGGELEVADELIKALIADGANVRGDVLEEGRALRQEFLSDPIHWFGVMMDKSVDDLKNSLEKLRKFGVGIELFARNILIFDYYITSAVYGGLAGPIDEKLKLLLAAANAEELDVAKLLNTRNDKDGRTALDHYRAYMKERGGHKYTPEGEKMLVAAGALTAEELEEARALHQEFLSDPIHCFNLILDKSVDDLKNSLEKLRKFGVGIELFARNISMFDYYITSAFHGGLAGPIDEKLKLLLAAANAEGLDVAKLLNTRNDEDGRTALDHYRAYMKERGDKYTPEGEKMLVAAGALTAEELEKAERKGALGGQAVEEVGEQEEMPPVGMLARASGFVRTLQKFVGCAKYPDSESDSEDEDEKKPPRPGGPNNG